MASSSPAFPPPHRQLCLQPMPTQGGSGDDSYSINSQLQNFTFHAYAKPHLARALADLCIPSSDYTFRIADFGCSSGRNTVECAEFVVTRLQKMHQMAGRVPPEIQYFFSDLPSNDFNSLFQTLEDFRLLLHETKLETSRGFPEFYAAGVPGSFHGRLFPKGSLDFAICSFALHWLSQAPPSVIDKTSPAWNGGRIWIQGDRPKVFQAYAQQFHADVKNFLRSRAHELAKGGVMFLFTHCRADEHPKGTLDLPYHHIVWCDLMESTWDELVNEGLIGVDERDLFNVPQYVFSRQQLEAAVKEVPELEVLKTEVMGDESCLPQPELQHLLNDPLTFGRYWAGFTKSLIKPRVEAHIGDERASAFFKRLEKIATQRTHLTRKLTSHFLAAILVRR